MTHWAPQQPEKKKKKRTGLKVAGAAAAALVILGCTVATSDGEEEAASRPQSGVTLAEGTPGEGPTLTDLLLPPSESEVPREFSNAKKRAESYLKSGHFSYDGLYQQLTSEYGEGFPPDAAQYAMDNIEVDWNEEAVEAAESYLSWSAMSRADLLQQLTSEYGEGFTPEQAEYAVNAVY